MDGPMAPFGIDELSPAESRERFDRKDGTVLLDVREHDEVAVASLPGALHIPMGQLGPRLGELPKDRDIIVFCHTGSRSLMVAVQMKRRGFARVFNMAGGIHLWSQTVDPNVPQYD
jgi:adenylyltransferase/sulfurtransferase